MVYEQRKYHESQRAEGKAVGNEAASARAKELEREVRELEWSVLKNSPKPVVMRVSKHFMVSIIASF